MNRPKTRGKGEKEAKSREGEIKLAGDEKGNGATMKEKKPSKVIKKEKEEEEAMFVCAN